MPKRYGLTKEIIEALLVLGKPSTPKEVADLLDAKISSVTPALVKMAKRGVLNKPSYGLYEIKTEDKKESENSPDESLTGLEVGEAIIKYINSLQHQIKELEKERIELIERVAKLTEYVNKEKLSSPLKLSRKDLGI